MNDNMQSIRGYRTVGDPPKPPRELAMGYLHQSHAESALHTPLSRAATDEGANCLGRMDEWAVGSEEGGDTLPTDRQAQLMCSGCPILQQCSEYAEVKHPSWGVWGARVYGRRLEEAMRDD